MKRYSKFRPTGFDQNIDIDRSNWLVAPVSRNRDSCALDESNWQAQIEILTESSGEESDTENWEIHRFGHWGCGWFEIAIVRPDSAAYRAAEQLENRLEDYPVLNEEDLSQREHDDAIESWNSWGVKEFRESLAEQFGLSENTVDRLNDIDDSALWELHSEYSPCGYETHSGGPHFDFRYVESDERFSRSVLAKFLNDTRQKPEPRQFTECQLHFAIL